MTARPLTDAEYDRVSSVLSRFRDEQVMNLEELDGFFAALICGPAHVHPSDYLSEIWGGEIADEEAFSSQEQLEDFLDLLMRHWNVVTDTLQSGDVFLPLLLEDEDGVAHANDWAQGFMRGMDLRREDWAELLDDEDRGGWLVPILALAHEHDPDPTMRPYQEPVDADRREQLIVGAAAGVTAIYRYFEPLRRMPTEFRDGLSTYRRTVPKIGRNDPCPCGSGKKYKRCCGTSTLH
jgi:uncharacterized protein